MDAVENCPKGSVGKASRSCDNLLGGWQTPDMFNCTSERFVELRTQVTYLFYIKFVHYNYKYQYFNMWRLFIRILSIKPCSIMVKF